MYKVINPFTDLQDNNYPYNEGDIFPRDGMSVSDERIEELAGNNNKQGKPLIKKVDETVKEKTVEKKAYTKAEINSMKVSELKKLAKEQGIENSQDISGAELKKLLIEKFGL